MTRIRKYVVVTVVALTGLLASALISVPTGSAQDAKPSIATSDRELYHLTSITDPISLDADQLAHIQELRGAWGVTTDAAYIESLYSDPVKADAWQSQTALFGGLLFAPSELPALSIHAAIEQDSDSADAWAKTHFGDQYAGGYLLGPELHLLCACNVDGAAEAARNEKSIPSVVSEHLKFDEVRYSLKDLRALRDDVGAFLDGTNAVTNGIGTTVESNIVEVFSGPSSTAGLDKELADRFPGAPVRVVAQPEDVRPASVLKYQPLIFDLVEGGQYIIRSGSYCTSAFAVSGAYGPFILTAGHCGVLPTEWFQGGKKLGDEAARNFGGAFDAAAISTYSFRNNYGHFHWNADYYAEAVSFVKYASEIVNQTICQTGVATTGMDGYSTACGLTVQNNYTPPATYGCEYTCVTGPRLVVQLS